MKRTPRRALPARPAAEVAGDPSERPGMSLVDLIAALRQIDGLRDVGSTQNPNFHFRSSPFLHFHHSAEGTYADVRFGTGDFEPVWASTSGEREQLLTRVVAHVRRVERTRKTRR
jgi:hypothetical protein